MHSVRNVFLDRLTAVALVSCAACWVASSVFLDVVSRDTLLPLVYVLIAVTATIAALVASTSTRRRDAANARRVPRIPGGNARFGYRPVSRHRGTVLMGSAPTLV